MYLHDTCWLLVSATVSPAEVTAVRRQSELALSYALSGDGEMTEGKRSKNIFKH
jgi:hypothetical protein